MKTALTNALESSETANLPIFVTDSNGKVVDYLAAINKNENYATALTDPAVNNVTDPIPTAMMNIDGIVILKPVLQPLTLSLPSGYFANNLPDCTVGTAYTANIIVTGGTPPYNYTASYLPTVSGTASFTLIATDSTKPTAETVSATFNFTVLPALSLSSAILAWILVRASLP